MLAPPVAVTFPARVADVEAIFVAGVVFVTVGAVETDPTISDHTVLTLIPSNKSAAALAALPCRKAMDPTFAKSVPAESVLAIQPDEGIAELRSGFT